MKLPSSPFKKNLNLLQKVNKKLAYQITLAGPDPLEFCKTEKGELNLRRAYLNQTYYYHSQIDATQEALEWFKHLDLNQATVLYVYGIGLGYYYEAAKEWLKSDVTHTLVFL